MVMNFINSATISEVKIENQSKSAKIYITSGTLSHGGTFQSGEYKLTNDNDSAFGAMLNVCLAALTTPATAGRILNFGFDGTVSFDEEIAQIFFKP
jgi:hypothetical protein